MRILKLTIILILISNLIACAQAEKSDKRTEAFEGSKLLDETNYSIEYPINWELNQSGQMGTSFMLFSPISSNQDQFKENVNLLIQDLAGYNLDLNKYVEISEGQIKTLITDGNIIESKRITGNDLNYQKVIYTGKQGVYELKFEQYYWVTKDKAYVLTLTCEENQFENYQEIGEKILKSFVLKNS